MPLCVINRTAFVQPPAARGAAAFGPRQSDARGPRTPGGPRVRGGGGTKVELSMLSPREALYLPLLPQVCMYICMYLMYVIYVGILCIVCIICM